MAARSRRLHNRVQMPHWLRDDNVEVRPHIYDRTEERRVNTLAHPSRRRRYVDVRETGWQELQPMWMPFDVNRLNEPLVSMNRYYPNVQTNTDRLKFAPWFQQLLDYVKHMDATHPVTSGTHRRRWTGPQRRIVGMSASEFVDHLREPSTWLPRHPGDPQMTAEQERTRWETWADKHDWWRSCTRDFVESETDSDYSGSDDNNNDDDDDEPPTKRPRQIARRPAGGPYYNLHDIPEEDDAPPPSSASRKRTSASAPSTQEPVDAALLDMVVLTADEPKVKQKVAAWLSASPTNSATISTVDLTTSDSEDSLSAITAQSAAANKNVGTSSKYDFSKLEDVKRARADPGHKSYRRPAPPARPSSEAEEAPPQPPPMAAKSCGKRARP